MERDELAGPSAGESGGEAACGLENLAFRFILGVAAACVLVR